MKTGLKEPAFADLLPTFLHWTYSGLGNRPAQFAILFQKVFFNSVVVYIRRLLINTLRTQSMSVERISSPNYFAKLQLIGIKLPTIVTVLSNSTSEQCPGA